MNLKTRPNHSRLDHLLCFQINRVHQLFNRLLEIPLRKFNLTYVQYVVLIVLWQKDQITVSELSDRVKLNNGTLTPLLKRLQRANWINRKRDPRDKRRVIITLTLKGRRKKESILRSTHNCLKRLNYSKNSYRRIMNEVKDIQYRLQKSISQIQQ